MRSRWLASPGSGLSHSNQYWVRLQVRPLSKRLGRGDQQMLRNPQVGTNLAVVPDPSLLVLRYQGLGVDQYRLKTGRQYPLSSVNTDAVLLHTPVCSCCALSLASFFEIAFSCSLQTSTLWETHGKPWCMPSSVKHKMSIAVLSLSV